jgi:putative redox protein
MAEHVLVRQNNKFEADIKAPDPRAPESDKIRSVTHIHELDPYTMLLTSLGLCTTIVLHTYAQNHDISLQEVEIDLKYKRISQEDRDGSKNIDRYEEKIEQELTFSGDLADNDRQKLFQVAKQCSIHKMMEEGIEISSQLVTEKV